MASGEQYVAYNSVVRMLDAQRDLLEAKIERMRESQRAHVAAWRYDANMELQPKKEKRSAYEPVLPGDWQFMKALESVPVEKAVELLLEHLGLSIGKTEINGHEEVYLVEDA